MIYLKLPPSGEVVWAVSEGSYSDYCVRAVCSSKEIAEELSAKIPGTFVESFNYISELPPSRIVYIGTIWPLASFLANVSTVRIRTEADFTSDEPFHEPAKLIESNPRKTIRILATGTDCERVVKSVSDLYFRLLAEGEFDEK